MSLTIQAAAGMGSVTYFSSYKAENTTDKYAVSRCDTGADAVCGELPAASSLGLQLASCISDLYLYVGRKSGADNLTMSVKYNYLKGGCRGKNATVWDMCGSLPLSRCGNVASCSVDCQLVNCVGSNSTVQHQFCISTLSNLSDLRQRCNSYHGTFPNFLY